MCKLHAQTGYHYKALPCVHITQAQQGWAGPMPVQEEGDSPLPTSIIAASRLGDQQGKTLPSEECIPASRACLPYATAGGQGRILMPRQCEAPPSAVAHTSTAGSA